MTIMCVFPLLKLSFRVFYIDFPIAFAFMDSELSISISTVCVVFHKFCIFSINYVYKILRHIQGRSALIYRTVTYSLSHSFKIF